MSSSGINEYYNRVLLMAEEILKNLGYKLIEERYYDDEYYGDKYVYEDIVIKRLYNDLNIYISGRNVLSYNKLDNKITYEPGNWPKVIEIIYDNIPNFLNERRNEKYIKEKKDEEIKGLKPYMTMCSDFYKDNENVYQHLKSRLKQKGIKIERVKDFYETYSNIQCTYDKHYFYTFVLYYNGEKVFEHEDVYSDSCIDIFRKRTMDEYLNTIKLGDWIPIFKEEVSCAKDRYNKRINEIINEMAERRARQLQKKFQQ